MRTLIRFLVSLEMTKRDFFSSLLKVVYTVDNPIDEATWKGRVGFINSRMVKEEIPNYLERVFYICGPPKMVDSLRAILYDELKLDRGKIKLENFSGYK
ncbi:MAG: hypothetical protein AB1632_10305 [Nitrospirota bacterium]